MQKVTGIGGLFFKCSDPVAIADWYKTHLGVEKVPKDFETLPWQTAEGATVFAPFSNDSQYFGREAQKFMVNFRVNDLDAMIAQLETAGIEVKPDPETYPNGRFARLHDPDGNPIELWEPA